MKLSDKITSLEDYLEATLPNGTTIARNYRSSSTALALPQSIYMPKFDGNSFSYRAIDRLPMSLWWAHRELVRQHSGIYEPRTASLEQIFSMTGLAQFMPHISRDEPDLIAFTMTPEDGMRDKQTRVALGRFLRKFLPVSVDTDIAKIESRHRSERNPNVKLLDWETQFDDCLGVYMSLTSCMGKDISNFHSDVHPLNAYRAPGWKLAVMYDGDNDPSARGIVWINPENEDDKRMVRVYGDPMLDPWLKRNGFKDISFAGAYLRTHVIAKLNRTTSGNQRKILMPYVDAGANVSGGNRPEAEKNGYGVWDGGERVYLIRRDETSKFPNVHAVQSTSGYIDARPTPINVECVISGKRLNAMTDEFEENVFFNGKVGFALKSEYRTHSLRKSANQVSGEGAVTQIKLCSEVDTFVHDGTRFVDSDAARTFCGFVKLAVKYYPDEQGWCKNEGLTFVDAGWIKTADRINVIDTNKRVTHMHVSETTAIEGYQRVASIDDIKTWAHPSVAVVRTTANRAVVPGVHAVTQMYDGTWAYTRHVRSIYMFGVRVYVPKEGDITELFKSIELPAPVVSSVKEIVESATRHDAAVRRVFFKHMSDRGDCYVPIAMDKDSVEWNYEFEASEIKVGVVRRFLALPSDDKLVAHDDTAAPAFHANGTKLLDLIDKLFAAKNENAQIPLAV